MTIGWPLLPAHSVTASDCAAHGLQPDRVCAEPLFWVHERLLRAAGGAHLLCARIMPQRKMETGTPNCSCSCCSCTSVAHLLAPYLGAAQAASASQLLSAGQRTIASCACCLERLSFKGWTRQSKPYVVQHCRTLDAHQHVQDYQPGAINIPSISGCCTTVLTWTNKHRQQRVSQPASHKAGAVQEGHHDNPKTCPQRRPVHYGGE